MHMSKELKGCSVPAEGKCRWVMRNGDGTEWETKAHYHKHEVEEWECSVPVKPIVEELK
jgi:hypothetical protein